jgi:hypothetical protein
MNIPNGFDKAVALRCANLVVQAYDQFEKFKAGQPWQVTAEYQDLAILSARPEGVLAQVEPFGFVAREVATGNVFVVFRGTISVEDWISDFSFPQVAHPWGPVEQGFMHIYAQCSASVQNGVRAAGAVPNVFVTGHSLGGALAILGTADLVNSGVAAGTGMYSLAGPRTGSPAFAARFNAAVTGTKWRIANTEDIVTTLPIPTPQLLPAGQLTTSPKGMMLMLAHGLDYEHVGSAVSFTDHRGSIADNHTMPIYLDALKKA